MVRYASCSVRNCENKDISRHRFPDPRKSMDQSKLWLIACNNPDLENMTSETIYKRRKICHIHFAQKDRSTNLLLKKDAVPTLHLPLAKEPATQMPVCLDNLGVQYILCYYIIIGT